MIPYYVLKSLSEEPKENGVYFCYNEDEINQGNFKFKDGRWYYWSTGRDIVEDQWSPFTDEEQNEFATHWIDKICLPENQSEYLKSVEGLITELRASMLIFSPEDDYKKGYNKALEKANGIAERYMKGTGLFQP